MAEDTTNVPVEQITIFTALKKSLCFTGRSTRKEFWLFLVLGALVCVSAFWIAGLVALCVYTSCSPEIMELSRKWQWGFTTLVFLGLLLPGYAVICRRLHDIGMTRWFLLPLGWAALFGSLSLFYTPGNGWVDLILTVITNLVWIYLLVLGVALLFARSQSEINVYGAPSIGTKLQVIPFKHISIDLKGIDVLDYLRKFKDIDGRASRKEFWFFALLTAGISIGLTLLNFLLLLALFWLVPSLADYYVYGNPLLSLITAPLLIPFALISFAWRLGILLPTISLSIRRLNDTGKDFRYILLLAPYLFLSLIGMWLPVSIFPPAAQIFVILLAIACGIAFLIIMSLPSMPDDAAATEEAEEAEEEAGADGAEESADA